MPERLQEREQPAPVSAALGIRLQLALALLRELVVVVSVVGLGGYRLVCTPSKRLTPRRSQRYA